MSLMLGSKLTNYAKSEIVLNQWCSR